MSMGNTRNRFRVMHIARFGFYHARNQTTIGGEIEGSRTSTKKRVEA